MYSEGLYLETKRCASTFGAEIVGFRPMVVCVVFFVFSNLHSVFLNLHSVYFLDLHSENRFKTEKYEMAVRVAFIHPVYPIVYVFEAYNF